MEASIRYVPWQQLGDILVDEGVLTPDQLRWALTQKRETGGRLGDVLVESGLASEREVTRGIAIQYGYEHVEVPVSSPPEHVLDLVPAEPAQRYRALPLRVEPDGAVVVAVGDATDLLALDNLRLAIRRPVHFVIASPTELEPAIARAYRPSVDFGDDTTVDEAPAGRDEVNLAGTFAPAVRVINSILSDALSERASDIHFEPWEEKMVVRARIDGVLQELLVIPRRLQQAVTTRLKVMGELDIAERRAPQDGRLAIRFDGRPVDLRIAVLPSAHGESVVLRLSQQLDGRLRLDDLGMAPDGLETFRSAVEQPDGAILVCGPTGSGKTTTLYAALEYLNDPGRSLTTIEDPIEYRLPGVNQIEVQAKAGLTFASGLRTILRSDPDVLLVGEIRDEETARSAVRAALTGHLVLTSVHSPSAAGAIARLGDIGVSPHLLASSLNCVVAQRLVRRLCESCRVRYRPTGRELEELRQLEPDCDLVLFEPGGCPACRNTGYRGRTALYEVLPVEGEIRKLLESSTDEILAEARLRGMTTIREHGVRRALDGVTSLAEVRRVAGDRRR